LNIDHHVTNLNFAKMNLVDTTAVATAEILVDRLPDWDLPLTRDVAAALLTGLITDTLGFRTSNMTPKALRVAANLMEAGAELPELYQRSLIDHSYEAMRFWAAGLSKLERDGQIVWTTLTMADRKESGYPGRDDADLINELSAISDAAISIVFVEQPNGAVKVSWRAQPNIDVSAVALKFGGGGHPSAAGAEVSGSLDDVRQRVLQETRQLLNTERIA
jgi:phosphoesterase RecJ-like protein